MDVDKFFDEMMMVMKQPSNDGVALGMYQALEREHRTNQQSFWRNIRKLADLYSESDYDMRNEASVEFTKKISEIDEFIPYI